MSNNWHVVVVVVVEVWPELMYPSVQWGRVYIREEQSFFSSSNSTDIMKMKNSHMVHTWVYSKWQNLSFYISIRILKTTSIKKFSGQHVKMTADNLHHAANTHTSTAWWLDIGGVGVTLQIWICLINTV